MDQALNSQKTPHTSPLRASYGMSFVSILMKNDRVIKGFYCTCSLCVVPHHDCRVSYMDCSHAVPSTAIGDGRWLMMTPSKGNIFHVTGRYCHR